MAKKATKKKAAKPKKKAVKKKSAPKARGAPAPTAATPKGTAVKKAAKKEPIEQPITVDKKFVLAPIQAYAIAAFAVIVIAALVWSALTIPVVPNMPVNDPAIAPNPGIPRTALATITLITDESCTVCGKNNVFEVMQSVFSEADTRTIDVSTPEAQSLIASLGIKAVPAYVFTAGIADTENFTEAQQAMRKSGDYYVLDERALPDIPARYLDAPSAEGEPTKGDSAAAVTIVEYSNPACGACRLFNIETKPMLLREYGDSVLFVYKSLPLNDYVMASAIARDCANEQGMFWEFNEIAYNRTALEESALLKIAEEVGLDLEQYNNCTAEQKYTDEVLGDQAEAMDYAIVATPTLFINGIKLTGVPSDEVLKELIDAELAA